MNSRERIRSIIAGKPTDRCGLWLGNPLPESWPGLHSYFKTETEEELRQKLGDDFRWICPQYFPDAYRDPEGLGMFMAIMNRKKPEQEGPLADCEDVSEVEDLPWPNPDYLSFDAPINVLRNTGEFYRASGFWAPFYHDLMNLFGMENYMMKMYTHPEVVLAVTDKVCGFYYEANKRFFAAAGNEVDGFFFGNDFGTQLDLICGPVQFEQYIMPWLVRFTELAHANGYQAILHSCGAIHRVVDRLINAGVDCLHPLQARAANMNAEILARDFNGRISFMGGVDTQDLLVNGTPEEVKADVRRIKKLLGPRLIVSPSHEALLPNVPPNLVEAMAVTAIE